MWFQFHPTHRTSCLIIIIWYQFGISHARAPKRGILWEFSQLKGPYANTICQQTNPPILCVIIHARHCFMESNQHKMQWHNILLHIRLNYFLVTGIELSVYHNLISFLIIKSEESCNPKQKKTEIIPQVVMSFFGWLDAFLVFVWSEAICLVFSICYHQHSTLFSLCPAHLGTRRKRVKII